MTDLKQYNEGKKEGYSWNDIPYLWAFLIRGVIKHREQGKSLPVNQRKKLVEINWKQTIWTRDYCSNLQTTSVVKAESELSQLK